MTQQLSFLEAMLPAPTAITRPVEPFGRVTPLEDIMETVRLPHPKMVWASAEIQLHQHTDGLWMWGTSAQGFGEGYGYQVGPKWGKFARSRGDALWLAADEIETRFLSRAGNDRARIEAWCQRQKQEAQQ